MESSDAGMQGELSVSCSTVAPPTWLGIWGWGERAQDRLCFAPPSPRSPSGQNPFLNVSPAELLPLSPFTGTAGFFTLAGISFPPPPPPSF